MGPLATVAWRMCAARSVDATLPCCSRERADGGSIVKHKTFAAKGGTTDGKTDGTIDDTIERMTRPSPPIDDKLKPALFPRSDMTAARVAIKKESIGSCYRYQV